MDRFVAGEPVRGLGAIGVVLSHLATIVVIASGGDLSQGIPQALGDRYGLVGGVFLTGGLGLPIFLVLSGYLIGRPFIRAYLDRRPSPALGPYARNRVLRIVPAFWLALALYLVLLGPEGETLKQTVAALLFFQNHHPGPLADAAPHLWSVDVEVAFYVLLPFAALLIASLTPRGW